MLSYIFRRLLIAIPVLIGVTIISFAVINLAPGSPVDMIVDPNISAADLAARKEALGLNAPLYVQYFHWIENLLQGNLGYSMTTYRPVSEMIGERIGPTVLLMGASLGVGLLIAVPFGILSATKQYSKLDYICTAGSLLGISVPTFFFGLSAIYIFSLLLKWLPSSGMITLGTGGDLPDRLAHLIMPVTVLGAFFAGKMVRYVRSCMLEILDQDYLRTARAKGLPETVVINRHALRNGLIPVVTVVGLEVAALLGGAVITEQIFAWPGLGQLTMESVMSRDYSTLMGLNLLAAVVVMVVNLLTDIIYSLVDPRIRYE
jgi:ABC-type dipeptide/oligopeptide/nickel transport systems, permease components